MNDPDLQGDDLWWMTRAERYTRACERAEKYVKSAGTTRSSRKIAGHCSC